MPFHRTKHLLPRESSSRQLIPAQLILATVHRQRRLRTLFAVFLLAEAFRQVAEAVYIALVCASARCGRARRGRAGLVAAVAVGIEDCWRGCGVAGWGGGDDGDGAAAG